MDDREVIKFCTWRTAGTESNGLSAQAKPLLQGFTYESMPDNNATNQEL